MPERRVVHQAQRVRQRQVVVRLRVVAPDVERVLRRRRVALQRGRRVIQRVFPGERVQQRQSRHRPLFVAHLQSVVVREEFVVSLRDVARPVGKRPREPVRRILLVAVHEAFQVQPVIADIRDVHQRVLRQLLLPAQEIALHVAVRPVLRNPRDVVRRWIERCHQPRRISLARRREAARLRRSGRDDLRRQRSRALVGRVRSRLRHYGKLRLRRVDGQNIARARARVVYVPCAETAANRCLSPRRIRETDPRHKVVQVRIHQRVAVHAARMHHRDPVARCRARRNRQHRLRRRIPVRYVVLPLRIRRPVLPPHSQIQRQFRRHLPVVLRVHAVQALPQVNHKVVRQLVAACRAEQEIRPVRVRHRSRRRGPSTRRRRAVG